MALKIRLRQQGRTNRLFYRLVVTDSRSPRDGKYVETLGWYNPLSKEEHNDVALKNDRVQHWIDQGAEISEKAEKLVLRAAPTIIKGLYQKQIEKRAKLLAKKKARKAKKN